MENEIKEEIKEEEKAEPINNLSEMVDRLEKANAEAKQILARQESLAARNLLGGQINAGDHPVEESAEEKTKKSAMKLLEGTGLDPFK